MIYPNGNVTINKLELMIDDNKNWKVVAKSVVTDEIVELHTASDLREYAFYKDYTIGYDFIGDWNQYNNQKSSNCKFHFRKNDIEVRMTENGSISAEVLKWENTEIDSSDNPSCFTLAYWHKTDDEWEFMVVGSRLFDYITNDELNEIWTVIKMVDSILKNY